MKRMKYLTLAACLLGGLGLFSSCSENDTPVGPDDQEVKHNRQVLVAHIENDAKAMADYLRTEPFNATYQAYEQLMALMKRDMSFIPNMKSLFTAVAERKSLRTIYPVEAGSELAKMGYLAYITFDNSGFGAQVVFDGKGGCRLLSADHLEFIFPAQVTGIGTTLFKLIIRNSDDCYQSVADAQYDNVKRLACISRLPKSVTMTLKGFIDNQEQTLSESVIHLELPQEENSEYVSHNASSYRISGRQNAGMNTGEGSILDYSLTMADDGMGFDYDYIRDGKSIINCQSLMARPQKENFANQMAKIAFDISDLKTFTIRLFDDLTLTGKIDNGAVFAQYFAQTIKDRQQTDSAEDLAEAVESLNRSCRLQFSCKQMTMPETMSFCLVQDDKVNKIEPALKDLEGGGLIPISQLVDQQTMDCIDASFKQSYTPAGNSASSILQFYSAFMQMMPSLPQ